MFNQFVLSLLIVIQSVLCLVPAIPPADQGALMARYIVHNSDYTSIATISTVPKIQNYPFVSITSISDGPPENGTGNTYMYIPEIDFTAKDVAVNNRVSLMMSLVQSNYCTDSHFDPEDPRCAHLMMSGRFEKIKNDTDEYRFAKGTLFQRHPVMASWPADHDFFFGKVNFDQIAVQDKFGGPLLISNEDYYKINASQLNQYTEAIKLKDLKNLIQVTRV